MRWLWLLCVCFACDDGGAGSEDAQAPETDGPALADPDGAAPADASVDVDDPDASQADVAEPDAARACDPGEVRCVAEGAAARLFCQQNGQFAVEPCPDEQICTGNGICMPDPANCQEGQRTCLEPNLPGICNPGEGFDPLERCPEGELCNPEGNCRSAACVRAEQQRSYLGCEHFATDVPNFVFGFGGTPDSPIGVVLANPDPVNPARVTVYDFDGEVAALVPEVTIEPSFVGLGMYEAVTVQTELRDNRNLPAGRAFDVADELEVPAGGMAVILLDDFGIQTTSNKGQNSYRFVADNPLAAYQFSPYCCNFSFTNDASLLLPTSALGLEYVYLGVPSWTPDEEPDPGDPFPEPEGGGYSATITVVGTRDETEVEVTLAPGAEIQPGLANEFAAQNGVIRATLQSGEVLNLYSTNPELRPGRRALGVDLSGTRVRASAPVSVFSGHECTFYPQDQGACDHLEEQLFPTDTWGRQFTLAPAVLRNPDVNGSEATYWKIQALADETTFVFSAPFATLDSRPPGFDGVPDCADLVENENSITLNAGEHCEFGSRIAVRMTADAPAQVMGVLSGQDSTGTFMPFNAHAGDPAIFLAPPESQYRTEYSFLAPTTYFGDYVTVIGRVGATLNLDGEELDLSAGTRVPNSDWIYLHTEIEDGPHRMSGSAPFGLLVYAYDDYVSYAFTGGLNLTKR